MSDSQRFPVAAHTLAYLAHCGAMSADRAISSVELAASIPTNPVVIRRVTGQLAQAGLVGSRAGAKGGTWLLRSPAAIGLDEVLRAVGGCTHLGVPPPGAKGCPVGERIPKLIGAAIQAADVAAATSLSNITVADLLSAD
mgnify:CR=1 FL=1